MILALTGTPGTGKTSVAAELDGFDVLDLTEFVKSRDLGEQGEEFEVDTAAMVEALEEELEGESDAVVEGHLSHHFPADYCVVLRCEPGELEERLAERGYSQDKIQENVESEALDVILQEAVSRQEKVIEVDTTGKSAGEVASEIERRMEEDDTGYGDIDWSDYF
ncbi:MAG: adenylate kinase family protein [Candidatus Nanohaloarchaea archaeon]